MFLKKVASLTYFMQPSVWQAAGLANGVGVRQLKRVIKIMALTTGITLLPLNMAAADVASQYATSCARCHDSGVLNAPKKGDKPAWQALKKAKGMNGLVNSVKKGMPQMPAGGLCKDCSDEDFKQLIDYMSQ